MTNTPKLQYISVGGTEVLVNKIKENTSAISSEATTARAAEKANADAIAVLNGDSNTEGSIKKAIKDLINAAPEELDTLGEIAEQLNNNENATAAINNVITKHVADAEKQRAELAKLIQANTESIKNNQTAIDTNKLTKITWADLKAKRDAGELIPGVQYRITDYNCTTTQTDTQSAGHQFDIIVTADSNNKLNEVARAIRHEGDENLPDATSTTTDSVTIKTAYFANSKLEAWKIWYCLDNDTSRFAWADATNGKGVIYRMIDEWNNDCPYDFKNIQFKRYKITKANQSDLVGTYLGLKESNAVDIETDTNDSILCYTFTAQVAVKTGDDFVILANAPYIDGSLESPYRHMSDESSSTYHDNKMGSYINVYNDDYVPTLCGKYYLPNNVFIGYFESTTNAANDDYCYAYCSYKVALGNNCYNNSFGNNCYANSFGTNCSSNSFGNNCFSNSFGNDCHYNSFGNDCTNNSFGNDCFSNSFGNSGSHNSFGTNCSSNSFGNSCSNNKLNDYYTHNKFENKVTNIKFSGIGTNAVTVRNYHIKQGMIFTTLAPHTITAKTGLNYELTVAKQSDGTVVEYCEADLLKANNTSGIV